MRAFINSFMLSLFLIGCAGSNFNSDLKPVESDLEYCLPAETNLKELGYIHPYKPFTSKGKSFAEFCRDKQNDGIFLNPKCLASITDSSQVDLCTDSL